MGKRAYNSDVQISEQSNASVVKDRERTMGTISSRDKVDVLIDVLRSDLSLRLVRPVCILSAHGSPVPEVDLHLDIWPLSTVFVFLEELLCAGSLLVLVGGKRRRLWDRRIGPRGVRFGMVTIVPIRVAVWDGFRYEGRVFGGRREDAHAENADGMDALLKRGDPDGLLMIRQEVSALVGAARAHHLE